MQTRSALRARVASRDYDCVAANNHHVDLSELNAAVNDCCFDSGRDSVA